MAGRARLTSQASSAPSLPWQAQAPPFPRQRLDKKVGRDPDCQPSTRLTPSTPTPKSHLSLLLLLLLLHRRRRHRHEAPPPAMAAAYPPPSQPIFPDSYVGFDSITKQIERKSVKRGFQFNVICVGKLPWRPRPVPPTPSCCTP